MAVKKDAAFYRKQRMDDEAKAKKGDKKAKAELSKIESKRVAARGTSTPKASGGGSGEEERAARMSKADAPNVKPSGTEQRASRVAAANSKAPASAKKVMPNGTETRAQRIANSARAYSSKPSAMLGGMFGKGSGTEQRAARMSAANAPTDDDAPVAQKSMKKKAAS